jgi:protein-S-isoprenylcysteine O-methyltransferase Ste14
MDLKKFEQWTKHSYSLRKRILVIPLLGILFVGVIPWVLIKAQYIDTVLALPDFSYGWINYTIGGILIILGLYFALWSIYIQLTLGKGTPAPMAPTQTLIVEGPFAYCRNPMTLGTIFLYAGISILIGSFSAVGIVIVFAVLLLVYIKKLEEKELEDRFGSQYTEYKETTPFLIPQIKQ